MKRSLIAVFLVASAVTSAPALAQSRGELLYSNHCIECHTSRMHWRDKRVARDWASLQVQVRRWQKTASLSWSEDDVVEVARYLNERIYRFESVADPAASAGSR